MKIDPEVLVIKYCINTQIWASIYIVSTSGSWLDEKCLIQLYELKI